MDSILRLSIQEFNKERISFFILVVRATTSWLLLDGVEMKVEIFNGVIYYYDEPKIIFCDSIAIRASWNWRKGPRHVDSYWMVLK